MKFNFFEIQDNDFDLMLKNFGVDVYINNVVTRAVITNTPIKEFNDKYISTQEPLKRGDIIYYDNNYWMVINQVTTTRYESYKAIIRLAEHNIVFNLSEYTTVTSGSYTGNYLLFKAPAILSQTGDFGLSFGKIVATTSGEMHVFIQENELTKQLTTASTDKKKHDIVFGNYQWEITGINTTNNGMLDITVKVTLFDTKTDTVNQIHWKYDHNAWDKKINDSMYITSIKIEVPIEPTPIEGQTTILTINHSTVKSRGSDGEIHLTWIADPQSTDGYRLTLFEVIGGQGLQVQQIETTALSYNFIGLKNASYYVEFESKVGNQYLLPQMSANITVPTNWL